MDKYTIIQPLMTMVFLTFLVTIRLMIVTTGATFRKDVKYSFFRLFNTPGVETPFSIESARQHYKNMFELPILFYLLCILLIFFNNITSIDVYLAWGFVISRIIHSIIRIPNQNVNYRFTAFSIGFIILLIEWILFGLKFI